MIELEQLADELAEKYHRGQKRKDGKDYITHPRACAEIGKTLYVPSWNYETPLAIGNELPFLNALNKMHDVLEDCDVTEEELRYILLGSFGADFVRQFMWLLNKLNKNNYKSYCEYILAVAEHPATRFVKRCDLMHNLSDLKPGSLRDKYELARHILENT